MTLMFGMLITHEWESLAKMCVLVHFRGVISPTGLPISLENSNEQSKLLDLIPLQYGRAHPKCRSTVDEKEAIAEYMVFLVILGVFRTT